MKDLYGTLGLTKEASAQEIKKAYRKLALDAHPDKGGDPERMGLLNEAYDTLSDSEKKQNFDANWEAFKKTDVEEETITVFDGYLPAGKTIPYSLSFREQHKKFLDEYKNAPLQNFFREDFVKFESGIYHFETSNKEFYKYHTIFSFVQAKKDYVTNRVTSPDTETLAVADIIKIFKEFLAGNYYGDSLEKIKIHLDLEIKKKKVNTPQIAELLLYEGVFEIIQMADVKQEKHSGLIFSLKKITDFAKTATEDVLVFIIPLFYDKYFRNLYAYALNIYWDSNEGLLKDDRTSQFDGCKEAKELLNVLKDRLSNNNSKNNEDLLKLIQYVRLLFNFEKDSKNSSNLDTANDFREKAFHLLDWLPVFIEESSKEILVNTFLQIGIKFQQASQLEKNRAIQMADESLALKMYLTAVGIGHHSTPDIESYATTYALKNILAFKYQDHMLNEIIEALKKRVLIISDMFPFFDNPQSNITFLRHEDKTIRLMRHLLKSLIDIYEYNKSNSKTILIDHSSVTILYQAYEACLKNWYQEKYDPDTEKKFRLNLMIELLFENSWTFLEVEERIDTPWIMINRDESGWIKSVRSLPYTEKSEFIKYRNIDGAEINHQTGEINFFVVPWTKERPEYEKLFTLYDLQEMLEKNLNAAIFSLDPVDPNKPYHPYNLMRFAPSKLFESELLNTMLLTDYILKFLTTNQEIQGHYPFEQRSVAPMIQHLPEYLRKIIEDFHNSQHSGALHRFWIEAEEIDIAISDEEITQCDITRAKLGALKMIVKKHRMERDIHGDLKDVHDEDEGWPIYVLTPEQMLELEQGKRIIPESAMIFIYKQIRLYYWENNAFLHSHVPQNYNENLIRLYLQPKSSDGKITPTTKNMPLIYRITKEMARQSGLSHRYSPEFIFAHEFTTHYDEFALYLPEFGRLRELSKIVALIRFLNGLRHANQKSLEALNYILDPSSSSSPPDTDAYRAYNQGYQKVTNNITSTFSNLREKLASSVLRGKWRNQLQEIKNQIGTLTFSSYSKEVDKACDAWYEQISSEYHDISSYDIWDKIINPQRSEIAQKLSQSKQKQCREQIYETFSSILLGFLGWRAYDSVIDSFMEGDIDPLAEALTNHERNDAQENISQQFPHSSTADIKLAFDDYGATATARVATAEARRQLTEQKAVKDRLELGFTQINLGKHDEEVDLKGKCLWVPATTRHEVKKDATTGLLRYSFFVYGGVSLQPRINVVQGGGGPLGGNSVGSGDFNRAEITRGFQNHHIISDKNERTKNHELLQLAGFNLQAQANRIYLPTHESQHPTRSIHDGRHTTDAMQQVASKMDRVLEQGKAENWSQAQYKQELHLLLSNFRQDLKAGNVALNVKCRPWAI